MITKAIDYLLENELYYNNYTIEIAKGKYSLDRWKRIRRYIKSKTTLKNNIKDD